MLNFFKKKRDTKKINYIFVIFFILFAIFYNLIERHSQSFFQKLINTEEYYDALYGNSELGCQSIKLTNPRVLFIGDSIGYHSWDFNILQKKIKKKIGACFLQGFSILSFDVLEKYLEDIKVKPEIIILSNSYRIFEKGNEGFILQHKKFLKQINDGSFNFKIKLLLKKLQNKNLFKQTIPVDNYIDKFISTLDNQKVNFIVEDIINKNKETLGFKNYEALSKKLNNVTFIELKKSTFNLCKYIKKNNATLIIANVPHNKMVGDHINKKKTNDLKIYQELKKCNKVYFLQNIENINNNKFFLINNYNKLTLRKFKKYINSYEENFYQNSFLDFTHMNRFGASNFTKEWVSKFSEILKNENK